MQQSGATDSLFLNQYVVKLWRFLNDKAEHVKALHSNQSMRQRRNIHGRKNKRLSLILFAQLKLQKNIVMLTNKSCKPSASLMLIKILTWSQCLSCRFIVKMALLLSSFFLFLVPLVLSQICSNMPMFYHLSYVFCLSRHQPMQINILLHVSSTHDSGFICITMMSRGT